MTKLLAIVMAIAITLGAVPASAQTTPDAAAVVAALKAGGLPIGDVVSYTAETDPNHLLGRPNGYLSKAAFVDTRLDRQSPDAVSSDDGGSVEVFATADGASGRKATIDAIGQAAPAFVEYSYLAGPVLLRLTKRLTPAQGDAYGIALAVASPTWSASAADPAPAPTSSVPNSSSTTAAATSTVSPSPSSKVAPIGLNCPDAAPIKGNKSSSGELIYHIPSGQFYARTQPEACFATGADAEAAGYRASQR